MRKAVSFAAADEVEVSAYYVIDRVTAQGSERQASTRPLGDVSACAVPDATGLAGSGAAFLLLNVALVALGLWCFVWPIRRDWPTAALIAWIWVTIEVINGVGHPLWSLRMGGYTPGVATAPVLLVIVLYLGQQLRTIARRSSARV